MWKRNLCASLAAASMVFVGVERAKADDAASFLGGALLGGIIVNEVNKNKARRTTTTTVRRSGVSSSQREQNRQVQVALNYFGYNVGYADGVLGRNSRSGIRRYQADMGYTVDGYLDPHETSFLLGSHQRALASAHVPPYAQIVATSGQAGLLRTYRNEQLGIATPGTQMQPQTQMAAAPTPMPVPAPAPVPTQPEPVTARADTSGGNMPQFNFTPEARSIRDHCDQINVRTAANGGLRTAATITDAGFALSEQFCLARTQAMSDSARIEASIPNMTREQVEAQCDGLAQAIEPQLQGIESLQSGQIMAKTKAFLESSGQPMAQLVSGGKVCLGAGYRADNARVALASAVLLTSAGQGGYGELVSHHLREGFGTLQAAPQQAASWMQVAMTAVANGLPVLGQGQGRAAVLKAASGGAIPVFGAASE
ncbi:peptidoglycan-binding domain-containing protein [Aquicoccus sp. SU-CL01552]|uniref:peptidoglycan-binding domain-containing protein n=1 Tax=Aquicoccus sp. SU-CL01552 TaxID=3127656 RepID=UPI00310B700A